PTGTLTSIRKRNAIGGQGDARADHLSERNRVAVTTRNAPLRPSPEGGPHRPARLRTFISTNCSLGAATLVHSFDAFGRALHAWARESAAGRGSVREGAEPARNRGPRLRRRLGRRVRAAGAGLSAADSGRAGLCALFRR